ncbi:MAG: UDP-N-acetylmuramate:L-alanyl-gamma-D-glutamyl-meso-diaminopimelate ligase [Nevskiales bacterium]
MHLHILGICGTFMGGVAALARAAGHKVTGSDQNVYPPMSTQLAQLGIGLMEGYQPEHLQPAPDVVLVGNVISRGNAAMEYVLDQGLPYTSGPQWLAEHVLQDRHVIAVAGTHGKTTSSSMLAWILEHAGLKPGFLIGGIPENFGMSARLGEGRHFVVEADEYDTAFFDKRSKFVHYRPLTAVLNNLEYDHADIFPDLASIERQFHHLVRTVPGRGLIVSNAADVSLTRVLQMGCWTTVEGFGVEGVGADGDWQARLLAADGSRFEVRFKQQTQGRVEWELLGQHNVANALAAIAAARHAGVAPAAACVALSRFKNVKRRLELRGEVNGIAVYDDFAHHPTAITTTLAGLRARFPKQRILAVLEPRSNTMRMGLHQRELAESLKGADLAFLYQGPELKWDLAAAVKPLGARAQVIGDLDGLVQTVGQAAKPGDRVVVMSNGSFGGIHAKLLKRLAEHPIQ